MNHRHIISDRLSLLSMAGAVSMTLLLSGGCSDTESYSDLLRDEERAVNWYLAQHKVETEVPSDSIFIEGKDAPFYRMNEDGTIYMQVIKAGDRKDRPKVGEKVYFRFSRENIKLMYEGTPAPPYGNADDLASNLGPTSFFYGNTVLPNTTQFGMGIQLPLDYMGFDSEVNLVLKAYSGFTQDQSSCQPFLLNVKYFRAEY